MVRIQGQCFRCKLHISHLVLHPSVDAYDNEAHVRSNPRQAGAALHLEYIAIWGVRSFLGQVEFLEVLRRLEWKRQKSLLAFALSGRLSYARYSPPWHGIGEHEIPIQCKVCSVFDAICDIECPTATSSPSLLTCERVPRITYMLPGRQLEFTRYYYLTRLHRR